MTELARFNLFLDDIVRNVYRNKAVSPEYQEGLLRFISLCRQVAHYDVILAKETYFAGLMVTYDVSMWLIDRTTTRP